MIERGPLMPGTFNPNTNLSWDTRMWTAAAVVKPETIVSDRYTTMKPTCRTPMASCAGEKNLLGCFKSLIWSRWYKDKVKLPGKSPWGRSLRKPPRLSADPGSGPQSQWCWQVVHILGPGGSPQFPPLGSGLGRILHDITSHLISLHKKSFFYPAGFVKLSQKKKKN